MSTIFCCTSISPYRPQRLDHDAKFDKFMQWAQVQTNSLVLEDNSSLTSNASYAIQLVRQVNYGPQESIRYFFPANNSFCEASKDDLLKLNFEKVNSYKNFRCQKHNKFFELNLYEKNPTNTHHWRATLARPSRDIDLQYRREKATIDYEPSHQEGLDDPSSQGKQGNASFPKLNSSITALTQKMDNASLTQTQPISPPDPAHLKTILRFLLPQVGKSFSSSTLLTLLALERTNAKLDLGLEFESLWNAELKPSNVITFLCDCTVGNMQRGDPPLDVTQMEPLVISAMRYVEPHEKQQILGQVRLREIVNRVLEAGSMMNWVAAHGDYVRNVFKPGLRHELLVALELCQRKNEQQGQSSQDGEEVDAIQDEKDKDDSDQDDSDYSYRDNYDDIDAYEPMKDLTACDKECGYCGHCDY